MFCLLLLPLWAFMLAALTVWDISFPALFLAFSILISPQNVHSSSVCFSSFLAHSFFQASYLHLCICFLCSTSVGDEDRRQGLPAWFAAVSSLLRMASHTLQELISTDRPHGHPPDRLAVCVSSLDCVQLCTGARSSVYAGLT